MKSATETKADLRSLYPETLYDDLYAAGLVGEGKVTILGHYTSRKEPRRGNDMVWREIDVLEQDSTRDSMVIIPIQESNGRILGDWTKGITSEQVKKIHEEAGVPIFFVNDEKKGDYEIRIHHKMELDLADPIQNALFKVIVHNSEIALRKEDMIEDQDYYFYSKAEEQSKKKSQMALKEAAVSLIKDLSIEAKTEILEILSFERGLTIPLEANADDILMLFQEQCWDDPINTLNVSRLENKQRRLVLYTLVRHNTIVSPNYDLTGPFYRVSSNASQEYGELIGDTVTTAVHNLGKAAFADLHRRFNEIKSMKSDSNFDKVIDSNAAKNDAMSNILSQVNNLPEYELPSVITKAWVGKAPKVGLEKYLTTNEVKFEEGLTNKELRKLITEHLESLKEE